MQIEPSEQTEATLYSKIGGEDAIALMIGEFYERVTADPQLADYFTHVGLGKLARMQTEFFSAALGGPIRYGGRPINYAHQSLGISREQFQRFTEHLFETLRRFPLSDEDRYQIIARINTYTDDVVTSGDHSID